MTYFSNQINKSIAYEKKEFRLLSIFLLLLAGVCSCSEIDEGLLSVPDEYDNPELSRVISPIEAIEIANDAYSFFVGDKVTPRSRTKHDDVHVIGNVGSRSNGGDTLAYIVNYPEDGGYSIIAASRYAADNILAFIPDGHLESLDDIEVPAQRMYVEMLLSKIEDEEPVTKSRANIEIRPMPEEKYVNDTISYKYGAVSELEWTQSGIFGAYCDNNLSGCLPLAAALVMAHFEEPKQMNINFVNTKKTSVSKTINIDWTDIKRYKNSRSIYYYDGPSGVAMDNIGLICRQFGALAGTNYKSESSSTSNRKAINTLMSLMPNRQIGDYLNYDKNAISNSLKGGPALIFGFENDEKDKGHTWVVEAYTYQQIKSDYYVREYMHVYWTYVSTSYRTHESFYFNWGWGGTGNGYYSCRFEESFTPKDLVSGAYKSLKYVTIK